MSPSNLFEYLLVDLKNNYLNETVKMKNKNKILSGYHH